MLKERGGDIESWVVQCLLTTGFIFISGWGCEKAGPALLTDLFFLISGCRGDQMAFLARSALPPTPGGGSEKSLSA